MANSDIMFDLFIISDYFKFELLKSIIFYKYKKWSTTMSYLGIHIIDLPQITNFFLLKDEYCHKRIQKIRFT